MLQTADATPCTPPPDDWLGLFDRLSTSVSRLIDAGRYSEARRVAEGWGLWFVRLADAPPPDTGPSTPDDGPDWGRCERCGAWRGVDAWGRARCYECNPPVPGVDGPSHLTDRATPPSVPSPDWR